MKRRIALLVLCLSVVAALAVPVIAAAQKTALVPCPLNYPDPASAPPGGGFVIFNNSAGPDNLEMTLALKGVMPDTAYDIYLGVDVWGTPGKIGTVTTNKQGNATFHLNTAVAPGERVLNVDVTLAGSGSDIYELAGIHDGPMGGVTMTFE
jgi:hypothetical protein